MHRVLLVVLCGALNLPFAATGVERDEVLHIEMKARAEVTQADVFLSDIAVLRSTDLGLLRRAMAVPLGHAPLGGEVVTMDSRSVSRWLRRQTGLRAEQIAWSGAPAIEVSSTSRLIAVEDLVATARMGLREHLELTSSQIGLPITGIEIRQVPASALFGVPAGTTSWRVRPLGQIPMAKRMLVWVDVFAMDRFVRSLPVVFEVSVFALVTVATTSLPSGSTLLASQVAEREIDIAGVPLSRSLGSIPGSVNAAGSKRLRRGVRSGEVLTQGDLQDLPAVSRGQWASVTSLNGAVVLESRVEVLQDGMVGQTVRVKQANSAGSMLARVSGPGRLEVQP
jgi:flagella basal body P-ring formation protein FlgA